MSQKWIRSKKWDDEHIPRAAWPLKFLLRAFSSVTMAVILLIGVSLYGAAASVPVGLVALAPTYMIYGLTLVAVIALMALLPVWTGLRVLRGAGVGAGLRFAAGVGGVLVLTVVSVGLWHRLVWPSLRYDEAAGTGFRLFKEYVEANKSVTVRRLRFMEMSELEFYGWWPLKTMLLLFVVNLVFATVRRIEFTFKNIGVLTVHTGIVMMAVGSMWYAALKEEGDMVLEAGPVDAQGMPTPGRPETGFYDNTTVAVWARMGREWEMRPLRGVPRYNDYNLDAFGTGSLADGSRQTASEYTLSIDVPPGPPAAFGPPNVDPNIKMRVVGYASYAELEKQYVKAGTPAAINGELTGSTLWWAKLVAREAGLERSLPFWPTLPRGRLTMMGSALAIEFTKGMSDQRWHDLQTPMPPGALHALVLEANGQREVIAAEPGKTVEFAGYRITVAQLMPQPPFPIITAGYQGAQSSVAVVAVIAPNGERFERYVYHRFAEISQDMLAQVNAQGMPSRRDADPSIRIGYVDSSVSQVYLDEVFGTEGEPGGPIVRAIMRPRGGQPTVMPHLKLGSKVPVAEAIDLELVERWEDSVTLETPVPVPAAERRNDNLGTHRIAAIAVEVSLDDWKRIVWLPFAQYMFKEMNQSRTITLPGGRPLELAFGRLMRDLPGMDLQLTNFMMIPHAFGGPTQDFKSEVLVHQERDGEIVTLERATSLNDPLLVRVPFQRRENLSMVANTLNWAISLVAPTQYKFSQAGWDADGWAQTEQEVAAGLRPRPVSRWTILGVGNNPGIYVIALGSVLMGVGIPWAFYVKPWLVQREKRKIQQRLAKEKQASRKESEPEMAGANP